MPTANPRTQVTLSPSLDLLVTRLARLQQSSKSQVLRELLEAAEPALQRAVLLMEAASSARDSVLDGLAQSLSEAQDVVEAQLAQHLGRLDQATGDLVTVAEGIKGRRVRGGGARSAPSPAPSGDGLPPVPVTRGVGSTGGVKRGRV
jgi:hypothetical protein